jgi:hypothetical protein
MKKTLKNQKVNATLQFLRRFPEVQTWLKPLTIIKPTKALTVRSESPIIVA